MLSMLKHMAARGTMLLLVDNADSLACGSAEEALHVLHEVHDLLNQVCGALKGVCQGVHVVGNPSGSFYPRSNLLFNPRGNLPLSLSLSLSLS